MENKIATQGIPSKRGFASMSPDKVKEIAQKGGKASALKAGYEGMAARGHVGGTVSASRAGHEGMSERGKKCNQALWESKRKGKEEINNGTKS